MKTMRVILAVVALIALVALLALAASAEDDGTRYSHEQVLAELGL